MTTYDDIWRHVEVFIGRKSSHTSVWLGFKHRILLQCNMWLCQQIKKEYKELPYIELPYVLYIYCIHTYIISYMISYIPVIPWWILCICHSVVLIGMRTFIFPLPWKQPLVWMLNWLNYLLQLSPNESSNWVLLACVTTCSIINGVSWFVSTYLIFVLNKRNVINSDGSELS